MGQQDLQIEFGSCVEDPSPLIATQLPGTDPADFLHFYFSVSLPAALTEIPGGGQ